MKWLLGRVALMAMLMPATSLAGTPTNDSSPGVVCEKLAGHPYELGHNGVGVESDQINVPVAVKACEHALAAKPDDVPTQFRLARSLLRLKACSDGLEMMHSAAEAGYAPAQAAFGAEFLAPKCGAQRDLETAFAWAEKAALQEILLAGVHNSVAEAQHQWSESGVNGCVRSAASVQLPLKHEHGRRTDAKRHCG